MRIPHKTPLSSQKTFPLLTVRLLAPQKESIPSEYMYVSYSIELIPQSEHSAAPTLLHSV